MPRRPNHMACCHELCVAECVKCRELFLNNFLNMASVVNLMQLTSRLLSGAVPGCDLLVLALSGVVPGVSWAVLGESSRAIRIGAAACARSRSVKARAGEVRKRSAEAVNTLPGDAFIAALHGDSYFHYVCYFYVFM